MERREGDRQHGSRAETREKAVTILEPSPPTAGPRTKPVLKVARLHCSPGHPSSPEKVWDTDPGSIASLRHSARSPSPGRRPPTGACVV